MSFALLVAVCAAAGAAEGTAAKKRAVTPKRPAGMSAIQADTLLKAYAKDRADTREWLKTSPTSYLATIIRKDFESRTSLTVGSAAECDVRIEDPAVKPRHLRVTVAGDSFRVEAIDPGANFKSKDVEMTAATLPPSGIKVGRYALRLSHQRYPAIIVFDPQSPRFKLYKGIKYFPPDLDYHIVASLTPNPNPDTTIILSTRGNQRRAVRVGWFDFKLKGKSCRLEATRLLEPGVGEKDFSLFFTDATTKKESYGVGRYLDVEALPDGRYVLDFNKCYNPACAYSDHYNCPIPPKENRLQVAIRAGEMDSHYGH
ncbi:MAG TPA: DUF1684 domain-containing protein [Candidatus Eisenbacteria bacterium]|nr:DUF1684 domain-containing protein [Candidatus Eisenbacteria bacterium]